MPLASSAFDLDAIVSDVRAMRRDASIVAKHSHIEFYAKVSRRVRVERRDDDVEPSTHRVIESGMAARVSSDGQGRAGFAAASGLSVRVANWILNEAVRGDALVSAVGLQPTDSQPAERWDLDPPDELPDEAPMVTAVRRSSAVRWVEAGTTVEVLAGADDRCSVRRRHRVWAQLDHAGSRLFAKRGFAGWEELIVPRSLEPVGQELTSRGGRPLLFTVEAASPLVLALVGAFHLGDGAATADSGGPGWTVRDDPTHAAGLSGGKFDDAGHDSGLRPLAENGRMVGRLSGPGAYRRGSFREPPTAAPSNLVVPSGESASPNEAVHILGCRVVRLGPELWVLDLELPAGERAHVRVSPRSLLARCVGRVGPQMVTAAGPIVPSLLFDGLEPIRRG